MSPNNRVVEPHLFDYFQKDKIDHLYDQLVDRSEKSFTKQQSSDKENLLDGQVGFSNLLTSLGLGVSAKAQLSNKSSDSAQTSYELATEQKLKILWDTLSSNNLVCDLNQVIKKRTNPPHSIVLVEFKAKKARFKLIEIPGGDLLKHQVQVSCSIEDYTTEFYCSLSWFQSSSISFDIKNNIARDIKGIASVKQIWHNKKTIALNPMAF